MALMKENEKTRKSIKVRMLMGVLLSIVAVVFLLTCTGGIKLLYSYFDMPTIIMMVLMNAACVMLSGKTEYVDILNILQKVSIPIGILIAFVSIIIVLYRIEDISHIGQNLLICSLAVVYAVVEYLMVFLLGQHVKEIK